MRTRARLSCLRIYAADNNDAVGVIASRLRHLHYLRQVVLGATLTFCFEMPSVLEIWVKPEVDPPRGERAAARVSFRSCSLFSEHFRLSERQCLIAKRRGGRESFKYRPGVDREVFGRDGIWE